MAQKTNIKKVIEILCQILNRYGVYKVTPELFRQAKFDMKEATKPFWVLLLDVLHLASHSSTEAGKYDETGIVNCVKSAFSELGYSAREFYELPVTSSKGSRELLLAFGWLLAKYDIINLLVDNLQLPLFELIFSTKHASSKYDREEVHGLNDALDQAVFMRKKNHHLHKGISQILRFVAKSIGNGKLRLQLNGPQLFVNEATAIELLIMQCPKRKLDSIINELQDEKELLEGYIKWIESEGLFWKWLCSVVDEKQNSEDNDQDSTEIANNIDQISLSRQVEPFSNMSEISTLCDYISLLLQKLSTTKLISFQKEQEQRRSIQQTSEKHSHCGSTIERVVEIMKDGILDIERKLTMLEIDSRKLFALDDDYGMQDVLHLPMPRR